jgi:phosphate transport system substrate-binding protein
MRRQRLCSTVPGRASLLAAAAALAAAGLLPPSVARAQAGRDYISIVGSSTVYPFATVVAEQFGRTTDFKTPKIESTGTGGGFKLFCAGAGVETPDISDASRPITPTEAKICERNGVHDIIQVEIGYDGIVLANAKSAPQFKLTRAQIYQALAKNVPDPKGSGALVPNPYRKWSEIDAALPDFEIEVLGPPPTSGTRDAFVELVMEAGCEALPGTAALEGSAFKVACDTLREDGPFIEAGENDNLIVQKIESNPHALGIFGYSFLEQNTDRIQGSLIEGVAPDFDAIADGSYPVARPLFFYVKKAHIGVIPGIREYMREFTSDAAWGDFGYLADRGLIPLTDAERRDVLQRVKSLQTLDLAAIERD